MRITGSTADAVIQSLYPKTNELLKRFEGVKKAANVVDGERDRLRKYIQEHVPEGKYEDVILTLSETASQIYPNADGKYVLKNLLLVDCEREDAGIPVVVLTMLATDAEQFTDILLHELQKSKASLLAYVQERLLGTGLTLDNEDLYSEKAGTKIDITVIPGGAHGTPRAD